jgi:hypothetical protein
MEGRNAVGIFHVYRKDGTSMFLHPFTERDTIFKILDKHDVHGYYGSEPRVESLTLFRNELYRLIETEVKNWVAEIRFIPRFLLSAGIFLLTYLALSFIVRDPLPVLDELAIAIAVSVVSYVLLGRKDLRSDLALKKRIALRAKVDNIRFEETEFIKKIERNLHAWEEESPEAVIQDSLLEGLDGSIASDEENLAHELLSYLEHKFRGSEFKKHEKRIVKVQQRGESKKELSSVKKWAENKKVDLPLFALYLKLKGRAKSRS